MKLYIRKAIAMVLMVCMVQSMLPVSVFAAGDLHPASDWIVMNEGENLTINSENSITIQALEGDLNKVGQNPEPTSYWLTDAPSGDFTATVKISGSFFESYQKAGILIYKDLGNTVSVVRRHHNNMGGNVFGMFQYLDTWDETHVSDPIPSNTAYLKIAKTGSSFEGFYSYDGETWTSAGTVTNTTIGSAESVKVGVYAVDGNALGADPLEVTFEDFTIDGNLIPFASSSGTIPVSTITLNKSALSLNAGETAQLTATLLPSYATETTIDWSSSDKSVATVADGLVTAVAEGTATITAKCGKAQAQCELTVYPAIDGIKVYLSDLNWNDKDFVTYTVGYGTVGLNAGVSGDGEISLGGTVYEKGIAAHATAEINLNIADYDAFLFTADIGINDNVGNSGDANFVVKIDGEEVFRKNNVTGADSAISVRIEVPEGAETLSLITEEGDTPSGEKNAYDHTVWANAIIAVPNGTLERVEDKKIQKVIDLIDALGEVTAESVAAVSAARAAYNALDTLQKEKVLNLPALEAAEEKLVELGAAIEQKRTPLMGWSSWNCYYADINEEKLVSQMDALISTGLADAGYTYFNVDDAYQNGRNAQTGELQVNYNKFPNGMKYIADYAHNLGLKAGIYTDGGSDTCASMYSGEGSRGQGVGLYGHWEQDLRMYFLDWGYDYIKVDWCGGVRLGLDRQTEYTRIGEYIDAIELEKGSDIVFNVCCWAFPGAWVADIADSWRISGDITCNFNSILTQIDDASVLAAYHSPGHVSDPDMLMVGNGMSYEEDKSHFAMWCMLAAPLVLGNDLTKMAVETLDIITNEELIAIDQDPAVIMAQVAKEADNVQTWVKPLGSENSNVKAVALLNRNNYEVTATVNWADVGFTGDVQVRDLWAHEDLKVGNSYTVTLPAHGTAVLKVTGKTETSKAILKAISAEYPASIDIAAEGELDWISGSNSKDNAFVITDAAETTVSLSAVTTQRTAKVYIRAEGQATVIATLDGKQAAESFTGDKVYTITYCGELGGPNLNINVEGGTIEAVTVANAPDNDAEPEQDVLVAANIPGDGTIDLDKGTIDYIYFVGNNGNVTASKAGILTDYVTAEGAQIPEGPFATQSNSYDYFELILPAADQVTQANIYYTLHNASATVTVERGGEVQTLSTYAVQEGQPNILSVTYTSAEDVRVTITLNGTFAKQTGMSLEAVTLAEQTDNVLAYPQVTQEGNVLTITADSVAGADAADTLTAVVTDAEGNKVVSDSVDVTVGGELLISVTLPDNFTEGTLTVGLEKAGQEYDIALPLNQGTVSSEQKLIGNLLAKSLVTNGAILLDVRTAEEYEAGHIDGAINILYTDILEKAEEILADKSTPIVVYCSAGKRSAQAQMALQALGYKEVYNIGPMESWYIEPTITIGGSDSGVEIGDRIGIVRTANSFEEGLQLYYSIGADTTFDDAVEVPENHTILMSEEDGVVKAYLTWNGEIIATAQRKLPLLINLPIPDVDVDTFMSDITWTKSETFWGSNQRDVSSDKNALSIAGIPFEKGIGSHAWSTIEANIPEGMNRFVAVAGIDAEVAAKSQADNTKVQFAVFIDDKLVEQSLELPYGYYHLFDIAIPSDAKVIRLESYNTDDGTYYDHIDWGIAGFVAASAEDYHTITVTNGTASEETALWGKIIALTAHETPEGQVFVKWEGNVEFANMTATDTTFIMPDADVTVTAVYRDLVKVSSIELDKTSADLLIGEELILTATVTPDNADDKTVTWTTSDASVATVENGKVAAIAVGSADITATAGGKSATCTVTVTEPVVEPPVNPFMDVNEEDYFYDSALWAVREGITVGDGAENTFNPDGDCLREQVVTFLWRAAGEPEPETTQNPFKDIEEGDYFYKAVLWAYENEIVKGVEVDEFGPEQACTRAQVAAFLFRYDGENEIAGAKNPFTDLVETEYYVPAVLWAVENGITVGDGSDTIFNPNGTCTRAQIVTFLYRYLFK